MQMIRRFATIFFIVDSFIIAYCLITQNYLWLLNTQIAFISSLGITIGSFMGYKRNVANRVKNVNPEEILNDDRDNIDKIEDPYDLYSEIKEHKEEELTAEEIKRIIKEEKSKVKRNSFKNTIFSAGGFASLYRIIGYGTLILGFFYLNNNKFLDVYAYLAGLFIVPLSVLIVNFSLKKEEDQ